MTYPTPRNTSPPLFTAFAAALLAGTTITPVLAQGASTPDVVFSATGLATAAEAVASSVTVITAEDIEKTQRRTIPDLLQTVPGLNVVQTGGPGGQTSVFIRGTNSNHTKVLIDGMDVSDPSSPNRAFDFGPLTTYDIERVEVLRGPQSGLYGSDALGGVISITTKTGKGPPKVTALIEGGSFGTFNQAAAVSGGTDQTSYSFNASHKRVNSAPVTPLEWLQPGQVRNNDVYDNRTFNGKVNHQFNDIFSMKAVARYTEARLGFIQDDGTDFNTFFATPNPTPSSSISRQFNGLTEGQLKLLDGRFNHRVGAYHIDIARGAFDPGCVVGFFCGPVTSNFHGQRNKTYWNADLTLIKGQTLLMGVEKENERGFIDTGFGSATGRTGNLGSFLELQSNFYDRFFVASNVRHDDNDKFGGHTTYRIAPALLIPETGTKLKASYGTGFHAPSIDQLFGPFGANLNLLPEESKGYDFGFEQGIWNKRIQFGVTYFNNDIRNLIESSAATGFVNFNVLRATTKGYEAFTSFVITERFKVRGDYTQTSARNAITGKDLRRRPDHKYSMTAEWRPIDALTLSATALWVSSWLDVNRFTFREEYARGYQLVNLAANYDIDKNLAVFARVDNVFNKHYQNPLGFEKTGIGAYAGIRVTTN
jgi:vitamin B12 transporter